MIPLLRILFETGLAVEQALRVLAHEGRTLVPHISAELRQVLQRVDSGWPWGRSWKKPRGCWRWTS